MGLGGTARKIQGISDKAEQMYKQVQELQGRIITLEEEVDDTHETVKHLDHQLDEQHALLVAIAEEQGLDPESIIAEAAIEEAEGEPAVDGEGTDDDPEPAEETGAADAESEAAADAPE